ncbi:hypothetical protein [Thiolapillus sp.]
MILLERQPIGAQPIVIEVFEVMGGKGFVFDSHTAILQQADLLLDSEG